MRRYHSVLPATALLLSCIAAMAGCAMTDAECTPPRKATHPSATLPATAAIVPATAASVPTTAAIVPSTAPLWRSLFDGKTLDGWTVADFAGHGEVEVADGTILLPFGEGLTGVTWKTGGLPKTDYEIRLDARRVGGHDFFCGLTFPVNDSHASLIVGGWGGGVVGISSINGDDASTNESTSHKKFETGKWYRVRVRVRPDRLQAWIDDAKVVDVFTSEKQIDIRPDIDLSRPLGVASWRTTAALRDINIRTLDAGEK